MHETSVRKAAKALSSLSEIKKFDGFKLKGKRVANVPFCSSHLVVLRYGYVKRGTKGGKKVKLGHLEIS